jgi:uncharacterized protein (DUF4213/DUF364 family)
MMSKLNRRYRMIGGRMADALGCPSVAGLYLPAPVADETFRDEFGFVFLADGSVGPFYVSMGSILQTLWTRHARPDRFRSDAATLLSGLESDNLADRALALGAYNALSAALFHASGFAAPDRAAVSGLAGLPVAASVGMVGYFCPLVDKLVERGCEVVVLEQARERVDARPGVVVAGTATDLRRCSHVLCTASVLINDTLDDVVQAVAGHAVLEMIGPSGSGVPDALFDCGVAAVGGIDFADRGSLLDCLRAGKSWGAAGRKYQLTPGVYPGVDCLLDRIRA